MVYPEPDLRPEADDDRAALERALVSHLPDSGLVPARLDLALRDAVVGGKRLRGRLLLQTATACGVPLPTALPAACALEMIHAASLVHDDLPCFDDAPVRRGRPSIHAAYGEATAVLVGDALIVQAFATLAGTPHGGRLCALLASAVGAEHGIVGGQALELEPQADLERYHSAKTGALYRFATQVGALLSGDERGAWRDLGEVAGQIAQVLDDIIDVQATEQSAGKAVGRDQALGRPNVVLREGSEGARRRLAGLDRDLDGYATTLGPAGRSVAEWISRQLGAYGVPVISTSW